MTVQLNITSYKWYVKPGISEKIMNMEKFSQKYVSESAKDAINVTLKNVTRHGCFKGSEISKNTGKR